MFAQNTNQTTAQQIKGEVHPKASCGSNTATLFAQPYNIDAVGFYFSSADEYIQKSSALMDAYGAPVEEFEIMLIDGDREDSQIFNEAGVDQCNFGKFLDLIEELDYQEKAALFYLISVHGYSMDDAVSKIDDVSLYNGSLEEAATELFDECYAHSIPENLRSYIDYQRFATDCEMAGDMDEFRFAGEVFAVTNAACI
jgi:hypothetical protein